MSKRRFHWNDPRTGLIELYNDQGARLTHMRYRGGHHRGQLIDRWRAHYGAAKFATFHFAITPDLHEDSLSQLDLRRPESGKWGLQGTARVAPKADAAWELLKRRLGIENGEKCHEGVEGIAANAPERDSFTPSFDDLPATVGLARAAQIDAKIEEISQVA